MRAAIAIAATVIAVLSGVNARAEFEATFVDRTMRIDLYHTGNTVEEFYTLDRVVEEGAWAGSRTQRVEPQQRGRYLARLFEVTTGQVLFARSFDSYFGEYRTTPAAGKGVRRTFSESLLVPFPRHTVKLTIDARAPDGALHQVFAAEIDPSEAERRPLETGVTTVASHAVADPHAALDIAILGEGYTAREESKFRRDLDRFTRVLLAAEPFASSQAHLNLRGVLKPSQESGCNEPSRGVWRSTALGASFDALGSERYLLTEDNRALRDVAAHVPYDVLVIMVNSPRYGGGGIYGLYCTFTSDNQFSPYLFVHELGHALAGLADEYYTSAVAYNEFYPLGVEPEAPNITALLDPKLLKWRDLLTPGASVPTPWEKSAYDEMDLAYQKRRQEINAGIASLMRSGAPIAEVERLKAEGERLALENARRVDAFLAASAAAGKVGAFEGAGYTSKGMFRPMVDCIMFSKGNGKPFCAVCRRALAQVIAQHGE